MSQKEDNAERMLDYLMNSSNIATITGDELSSELHLSAEEINEAVAFLKSLGALEVIRKFNNTKYTFKDLKLLLVNHF